MCRHATDADLPVERGDAAAQDGTLGKAIEELVNATKAKRQAAE